MQSSNDPSQNDIAYYPESTPLINIGNGNNSEKQQQQQPTSSGTTNFFRLDRHWIPSAFEESPPGHVDTATVSSMETPRERKRRNWLDSNNNKNGKIRNPDMNTSSSRRFRRSWRRRVFLFLTEPESSLASAWFFVLLVVLISLLNVVMIFQTMDAGQYTPEDCKTCGGPVSYIFDNDDDALTFEFKDNCICPPTPLPWTETFLAYTIYFFSVEWTLRVLTFAPPPLPLSTSSSITTSLTWQFWQEWWAYCTSTTTVLDALAIFPYYAEAIDSNGLMSLRLLRLFRVFQLVRLGQYNESFLALTTVLWQSLPYLKLLLGVLAFGAVFFGSLVYWLEKGQWQWFEEDSSFHFVRWNHAQGAPEISPFNSIPQAFWWFFVTATTVGYGDIYPTTVGGKWVAIFAMMTGVLVIAFPVSVFSDLWSKQLRESGLLRGLDNDDDDDDDDVIPTNGGNDNRSDVNGAQTTRDGDNSGSNVRQQYEYEEAYPAASYNYYGSSSSGRTGVILNDASTRLPATTRLVDGLDMTTGSSTINTTGDHICIRREDWTELLVEMQSIQESQRRIRSIFKKYKGSLSVKRDSFQ